MSSATHTGRSQNVVERVAEALRQQEPSIDLPKAVISAASEKYRLLSIQVRVGSIVLQPSSQKDTSERRAAALLEYCARQYRPKKNDGDGMTSLQQLQIPWPALAAAVQTKSHQPIQQLQHILVNFLQPTSFSQPVVRKRSYQDDTTSSSKNDIGLTNNRSLRHRMHSISYKEKSIVSNKKAMANTATSAHDNASTVKYVPRILHELVIRLTGHLDDPHGLQIQTCQLLRDIYAYYENDGNYDAKVDDTDVSRYSNSVERRGHLYDLQRYAAAYEAAALYHIATTTYPNNNNNNNNNNNHPDGCSRSSSSPLEVKQMSTKGNKGQRKERTKKGKDEALNPEDEDVIDTNENDDYETFEALYNNSKSMKASRGLQIDDLMEASNEYTYLEIMQVLPRVQALAKKLQGSDTTATWTRKRKNNSTTNSKVRKDHKLEHGSQLSTAMNIENEGPINDNGNEPECTQYSDSRVVVPSFRQWKDGVLSAVVEQARREALPMIISQEEAITRSANAILQKYGILPFTIQSQDSR